MNYTLNLSGILFLGLGVAAATMIFAGIDAQTASNHLRHLKVNLISDQAMSAGNFQFQSGPFFQVE